MLDQIASPIIISQNQAPPLLITNYDHPGHVKRPRQLREPGLALRIPKSFTLASNLAHDLKPKPHHLAQFQNRQALALLKGDQAQN
jgi:hypothetical protein